MQIQQVIKNSIFVLLIIALLCLHSCMPEPLPV